MEEAPILDAERFDALVRSLDLRAPRRAALGVLGGGLGGLLTRLGVDHTEAKKRKKKKKCKGKKRKCGKKCIPKSKCCKDSNCGDGLQCCNGACIEDSLCCADNDCFSIYTCEGGFCTCIDDPSDVPCNDVECCDPATEVCTVTETTSFCQAGGCPAGADVCNDGTIFFCGGPGACVCTTSVEERTVCTDFAGVCTTCTTDAQCADVLDQDAVCIVIDGECTCDGGETTACVAVGCPSGFAAPRAAGGSGPRRDLPRPGR